MAVKHVDSIPRGIVRLDLDRLARPQPHDVLEPLALVRVHRVPPAVLTGENLEINQVNVNRMAPSAAAVFQLPELHGAPRDIGQHAVGHIRESNVVDPPLSVGPLKLKVVVHGRPSRGREVDGGQGGRDDTRVGNGGVGDNKAHHFVGMKVVVILADIFVVAERDVLTSKGRKVKHHLIPLGHADVQVVGCDRGRQESGVGGDDLEGDLGRRACAALEVKTERARDGGIEESKTVFAGLHVEEGPRLAIDVDDIAIKRVGLASRREQLAVGLVLLGREDQRDVVNAVDGGEIESVLRRVMNDVAAGLTWWEMSDMGANWGEVSKRTKISIFSRLIGDNVSFCPAKP